MSKRGRIGSYEWGQFWQEEPELRLPDIVRGLRRFLLGATGVNVAFDSGRLGQRVPLPHGWRKFQDYAVSPAIANELVDTWPHSEHGFDEWYFFRDLPAYLEAQPFCNWMFQLDQWEVLRQTESGFDLSAQLERLQPKVVIGEGHPVYVLSRDALIVDSFLGLACEP